MGMTEQEKKKFMLERAKEFFDEVGLDEDENTLRDDITDVVETTIGKGSASEDIVKNLILLLENAGIEIE